MHLCSIRLTPLLSGIRLYLWKKCSAVNAFWMHLYDNDLFVLCETMSDISLTFLEEKICYTRLLKIC